MIPLVYFVIAWLALIAIFALMTFITVLMNVRYGLSGMLTYLSTALFLTVICGVLLGVGSYLITIDWTQDINIIPSSTNIYEL